MKFEVQETPKMRENIEKHKRVFETYELTPYVFEYENKYYYHIDYSIFTRNILRGTIILNSDGSITSKDVAEKVFENITLYNTAIRNINNKLIPYLENPIWPVEKIISRIKDLESICNLESNELGKQIKQIKDNHIYFLNGFERLIEIYEEFIELDTTLYNKTGILTEQDVKKAELLVVEWKKFMYKSGHELLDLTTIKKKVIKNLLRNCKMTTIEQNNIKTELITLLMADINADRTLDKSLRKFEKDKSNKRIFFSKGEKGLDEMISNRNEISDEHFIKKVLPYLRN